MPRLSISIRRRVVYLRQVVYSITEIQRGLNEESILISSQALFNLVRKYKEAGKLIDIPRRTHPRKLNNEMMHSWMKLSQKMINSLLGRPIAY